MATEPMTVFVKDIQHDDQIMIGGVFHDVVDTADVGDATLFLLHNQISHLDAEMTLKDIMPITIRRPIK